MTRQTVARCFLSATALAAAAVTLSCKDLTGVGDLGKPVPTPTSATVTLRSTGPDPSPLFLRPGGQVRFENDSGIDRTLASPCAELNVFLPRGSNRSVRMPSGAGFCHYNDASDVNYAGAIQLCSQRSLFGCD